MSSITTVDLDEFVVDLEFALNTIAGVAGDALGFAEADLGFNLARGFDLARVSGLLDLAYDALDTAIMIVEDRA